MTPDKNGNLAQPKQNTEAPKDTLLQPENTSEAHNLGQLEHNPVEGNKPFGAPGYCVQHLTLGCEECA
jgi:hypothetical protein